MRTALTVVSISAAFALFGLLQGFVVGVRGTENASSADRLFVVSRISPFESLPYSYGQVIKRVQGVVAETPGLLIALKAGSDDRVLVGIAVEPDAFDSVYHDWALSTGAVGRLRDTPDGVIVGQKLASHYGWRVGDRLPLHSTALRRADGSLGWPLTIVGTYDVPDEPSRAELLLLNYSYVDNAKLGAQGRAGAFSVRIADRNLASSVASTIDALFRNSPDETRTSTEEEIAREQADRLGNIDFVVHGVTLTTFLALLLSVGSVLSQSLHERRRDFGTMKAIGLTDTGLMALLTAEALMLCLASAALGFGIAFALLSAASDLIPHAFPSIPTVANGVASAVVLAIVTVMFPGIHAARLRVVDALSEKSL